MSRDSNKQNTTKRICARGQTAKRPVPIDDVHYTCLCMTTMHGDPVQMVCIVGQKEPLDFNVLYGVDITAPWIGPPLDETRDPKSITIEDLKHNIGPGRRHPGGVTITFKGKEMKMRVFHNETGTMTSHILVEILKGLDAIKLFDRHPDMPPPAILVDGHSSRFGMPFLNYISNQDEKGKDDNGECHYWNAYIGLPNCTALWQVGDSSEQNGQFKTGLRIAANRIIQGQRNNRERLRLQKRDIIPMIMEAYPKSFGNRSTNRMALAKRGWNPMNRNTLLDATIVKGNKGTHRYPSDNELDEEVHGTDKDINTNTNRGLIDLSIQEVESQKRKSRSEWQCSNRHGMASDYSISDGKAFDVLELVRNAKRRNIAGETKLLAERAKIAESRSGAVKQAEISKRITAGTEALRGNLSLRDKTLKGNLRIKEERKDYAILHQSMKWYTKTKKQHDMGVNVMKNKPDTKDWKRVDYGMMIQFKQLYLVSNPANGNVKRLDIPDLLKYKKKMWNDILQHYPDPECPSKPKGYDEYLQQHEEMKAEKLSRQQQLATFNMMDT